MSLKFYKKRWFKIIGIILIVFLVVGGIFAWRTGRILKKISNGSLFTSVLHSLPLVDDQLKGEKEGRINILLLGMRGEHVDGGGLLADTIIVVSIKPAEKKVAMISIPRDLYVTVPGTNTQSKINAVYFYGEKRKHNGGGLANMKKIVGEISGQPIHYAVAINFKGFSDLVDAIGGVPIHLNKEFIEPLQFHEEHVCDQKVFTVPSGNYEEKKNKKGKVVARYPLCYNAHEECGGIFRLPAGDLNLNGEQALCYVRSRVTSSDFERARRQQQVIQEIKKKALTIGTLSSFSKVNAMLDALGDNVRTDMQLWEMKALFNLYKEMGDDIIIKQKVLENSSEGLLYAPQNTRPDQGYILLPRGDNYDKIKEMFKDII